LEISKPSGKEEAAEKEPFKPHFLFFYSSLMDTEVLQSVLDLPEPPTVGRG